MPRSNAEQQQVFIAAAKNADAIKTCSQLQRNLTIGESILRLTLGIE